MIPSDTAKSGGKRGRESLSEGSAAPTKERKIGGARRGASSEANDAATGAPAAPDATPTPPMYYRRYKVVGPCFGMIHRSAIQQAIIQMDCAEGSAAGGLKGLEAFADLAWGEASRSSRTGEASAAEGGSVDVGEPSPVLVPNLAMLAKAASDMDFLAVKGGSSASGGSADGGEPSPIQAQNLAVLANTASAIDLRTGDESSVAGGGSAHGISTVGGESSAGGSSAAGGRLANGRPTAAGGSSVGVSSAAGGGSANGSVNPPAAVVSWSAPDWTGLEIMADVAKAQTDPLALICAAAEAMEAQLDGKGRWVEHGAGGWGAETSGEDEDDEL